MKEYNIRELYATYKDRPDMSKWRYGISKLLEEIRLKKVEIEKCTFFGPKISLQTLSQYVLLFSNNNSFFPAIPSFFFFLFQPVLFLNVIFVFFFLS